VEARLSPPHLKRTGQGRFGKDHMASKPETDRTATARRRLTEKMLRLDQMIDKQSTGSAERLALLRQQADLSDQREALISDRR
jgi:hypothetical protein